MQRGMVDKPQPYGLPMSARYMQSFAYDSMARRNPSILEEVATQLKSRPPPGADIDALSQKMTQLAQDIRSDTPWEPLTSKAPDAARWNAYLKRCGCPCTRRWLSGRFLTAEAYLYRRVQQIAEEVTASGQPPIDPFGFLKEDATMMSLPHMEALGDWLERTQPSRDSLFQLIRSCASANRADLSLAGAKSPDEQSMLAAATQDSNLLVDHEDTIWSILQSTAGSVTMDIVCDNSGFELFSDFCLAHMLCQMGVTTVRFHLKNHPWFVSDATINDQAFLMKQMSSSQSDCLPKFCADWTQRIIDGTWIFMDDVFWTMPQSFDLMARDAPELYATLQESALTIFKGDVNYRKLVGDIRWPPETRLEEAVRSFRPCPLAALRTVKSEVIVGLPLSEFQRLDELTPGWMTTGEFATVTCVPDFVF